MAKNQQHLALWAVSSAIGGQVMRCVSDSTRPETMGSAEDDIHNFSGPLCGTLACG